jgi:hypothetical protein
MQNKAATFIGTEGVTIMCACLFVDICHLIYVHLGTYTYVRVISLIGILIIFRPSFFTFHSLVALVRIQFMSAHF